jgi:O-antigen ligase
MSNRWSALAPYEVSPSGQNDSHSNNLVLNHLLSDGIMGLIMLLFITLFPVVSKYRSQPQNRDEIYLAAIVAAALHGNGLTTAIFGHYMHGTFWAVALVFSLMIKFDPKSMQNHTN